MHSAMRSILNKYISIFMRRFLYIIMIVVLFFRRGIMGDKELPDLLRKKKTKSKEAAS